MSNAGESAESERVQDPWTNGILLDGLEGWVVPRVERIKYSNILGRSRALYAGMRAIAGRVAHAEQAAESVRAVEAGGGCGFYWNRIPGRTPEEALALLCDFDAFANCADCYVRVCMFVAIGLGFLPKDRAARDGYRLKVLGGPIVWYRDKVGAHISGATVNPMDTDAERWISSATRLDYTDLGITVGGEGLEGSSNHSPDKSRWGVTGMFRQLSARFWDGSKGENMARPLSELDPEIGVVLPASASFALPVADLGGGIKVSLSFGAPGADGTGHGVSLKRPAGSPHS